MPTKGLNNKKTQITQQTALKQSLRVKKPPFLFEQTQEKLQKLEEKLGCPVLSYFKPPLGNIWSEDLYAILECLKTIGKVPKLALYVRSNGGQGMVSLRIIHLLRSFAERLILLAPLECASAATILALGCDEIHMGPLSSLSPVDSSLTHPLSPTDNLNNKVPISLDELWRVIRLWQESERQINCRQKAQEQILKNVDQLDGNLEKEKEQIEQTSDSKVQSNLKENKTDKSLEYTKASPSIDNPYKYLYEYIHPMVFGAVDRHSSLSVRICKEVLSYHLKNEDLIEQITNKLNYDYPAHSYPITVREAKKIGLNVVEIDQDIQDILNKLQLLYSELSEEKITDYDNLTYHDNSIYSLVETRNVQLQYVQNYDKFYRENEKRYITLNDQSGWYKITPKSNVEVTKEGKSSRQKYLIQKIYF